MHLICIISTLLVTVITLSTLFSLLKIVETLLLSFIQISINWIPQCFTTNCDSFGPIIISFKVTDWNVIGVG